MQPWELEPDHVEFKHKGFPCILHRNTFGAWCGYVGVPPSHPWHGKHYDDVPAEVHGGLTYSEQCRGNICHKAEPGEPDDVWWVGFDCNHGGDSAPGFKSFSGQYRDIRYVTNQTCLLAIQASEAS